MTRAVFVCPWGYGHHFGGVPEALERLGIVSELECVQRSAPVVVPREVAERADVLVHADGVAAHAAGLVAAARRAKRPVVLVMDGVLEYANTFLNRRVGEGFLAPGAADVVLASGAHDARVLRALGNRAVAAGLPRLDAFEKQWREQEMGQGGDELLVATANTVSFTAGGRQRVVRSLERVRDAAARMGVRVRWRVSEGLGERLGVAVDTGPLIESLGAARGVMTTASTLVVEAMLAGKPVCVVHPHPWALWQAVARVWAGDRERGWAVDAERVEELGERARDADAAAGAWRGRCGAEQRLFGAGEVERAIGELMDGGGAIGVAQEEILRVCYRGEGAERCAQVIGRVARMPLRRVTSPPERVVVPGDGRVRVVSCIERHAATVGGVETWSVRMGEHFAARPGLGVDWRTVYVEAGVAHARSEDAGALRVRCAVDPTASPVEQVGEVARFLGRWSADVVLPNYGELAHKAGLLMRAKGARVVAIAHTNDAYYKGLLERFGLWDGAVGVSPACSAWLEAMAGGRAYEEIVYGVPVHAVREVMSEGRLRIAFVGRVVEAQKRVSDLLELLRRLEARGLDYEFHMVGDGAELDDWSDAAARIVREADRLIVHGARSAEWVQRFWQSVDIAVNVSDGEGTSISMLEAMAAGAVPCVTRVDAGVSAVVRHGENGVLVEVGEMERLAEAIAALDSDRARLHGMAVEAQRTLAARGLTIGRCAERYAGLLKRLAGMGPPSETATDQVCRGAANGGMTRRAARCEEIAAQFGAVGYGRVARGTDELDEEGIDAVVIRAGDVHPGQAAIEALRARGIGVAVEPTLDASERSHITGQFEEAVRAGRTKIGVVVGRSVSLAALHWIASERRDMLGAFVAPGAGERMTLFGVPAVCVEAVHERGIDALVMGDLYADIDSYCATLDLRRGGMAVYATASPDHLEEHIAGILNAARGVLARGGVVQSGLDGSVLPGAVACAADAELVILPGDEGDFARYSALRGARHAGTRVVSFWWCEAELGSPERYAAIVEGLDDGAAFAVYGAGLHTRRLIEHSGSRLPAVIVDDAPGEGREIGGVVVVGWEDPRAAGIGVVVLSSPGHEDAMWARTEGFRARGGRVFRLYGG